MTATIGILLALIGGAAQTRDRSAPAQTASSPITRNEHPRIWVTRDTLPALRSKLGQGGGLHKEAVWWADAVDDYLDAPFGYPTLWATDVALAYLLTRDGAPAGVNFRRTPLEYGAWAKNVALDAIAKASAAEDETGLYPLLLDWLWDLYSPDERTRYATFLKTADAKGDAGSPWVVQHAAIRGVKVFAGIALHGAGIDDKWAAARLTAYRAWFRDPDIGVTRSESDLGAGIDAGCGQGLAYCWGHTLRNVLMFEEGYRTAMNISEAVHYGTPDTNFFRLQPRHLAYRLIPAGGKWWTEKGHYHGAGQLARSGTTLMSATFDAIAGIYTSIDPDAAALASWAIQTHLGRLYEHRNNIMYNQFAFFRLIRGAEKLPAPKSPGELRLPLTVGGGTYERVIWKTSWGADDVQVVVHVNKWGRNYWMNPPWPGSFQVFRNGPQVLNQWGAPGGHEGSWLPGNMLMFPHVTPTKDLTDLGGHRGSGNPRGSAHFVEDSAADERDELIVSSGAGFESVFVDHTRAYRNTRTGGPDAHVSEVTRHIVFLKPSAPSDPVLLVVLDRFTKTSNQFEARWILHTSGEPKVQADGRVCALNPEFPGRTCVTTLTPQSNAQVYGGSWTPYEKTSEFISTAKPVMPWVPNWTIDIRPQQQPLSDTLLHVIEVSDPESAPTAVRYLGGSQVSVGGRLVAFDSNGTRVLVK
jgi:hypothetical protein